MYKSVALMLSLLLSACGASQDQSASSQRSAQDTVFGGDLKALDKARKVQDTLMQDKANADAAIDAATKSQSNESSAE